MRAGESVRGRARGWGGRRAAVASRACTHTHRRRGLALPATALAAAGGSSPFTSASSFSSSPAAAAQPGLRSPSASGARAPGRRDRCTRPRGGVTGCGCCRGPHCAPGSRDGSRRGPKDQKSRLGRAETRRGHVPPDGRYPTLAPDAPRRRRPPWLPPSQLCPALLLTHRPQSPE